MAFLDIDFPQGISYGSSGGPSMGIDIIQVNGGATSRNQYWADPLRKWDAMAGVRDDAMLQELQAFFMTVGVNSFRFKDWKDFQAANMNATGTMRVLTATTLQLTKTYTVGSTTYVRDITKPRVSPVAVTMTRNGSAFTSFTLVDTTGIITVADSTGTWVWNGEFDVPSYFGSSDFSATFTDAGINSITLPVVEER